MAMHTAIATCDLHVTLHHSTSAPASFCTHRSRCGDAETRHIIEALAYTEPPIRCVVACGGLSKNPLYLSTHADVLQMPIHTPLQEEAVLLGAAILGATAGAAHPSVEAAMSAMSAVDGTVHPRAALSDFHERKYTVFRRMSEHQRSYREIMEGRVEG